jgi:hypothetical protein
MPRWERHGRGDRGGASLKWRNSNLLCPVRAEGEGGMEGREAPRRPLFFRFNIRRKCQWMLFRASPKQSAPQETVLRRREPPGGRPGLAGGRLELRGARPADRRGLGERIEGRTCARVTNPGAENFRSVVLAEGGQVGVSPPGAGGSPDRREEQPEVLGLPLEGAAQVRPARPRSIADSAHDAAAMEAIVCALLRAVSSSSISGRAFCPTPPREADRERVWHPGARLSGFVGALG